MAKKSTGSEPRRIAFRAGGEGTNTTDNADQMSKKRGWVSVPVLDPAVEIREELRDESRETQLIPTRLVPVHHMLQREMERVKADACLGRLEALQRRANAPAVKVSAKTIFRMNPLGKEVGSQN